MTDAIEALSRQLGECALQTGAVIATAESCTAGGIAYAITDIAGSSAWFDRGFVTYSNASKVAQLGVREDTLLQYGAVSAETVSEMLMGALQRSNATIAVAVSGIAGPAGGTADKPVGTVFIGWCQKGSKPEVQRLHFNGGRRAVRLSTVAYALEGLVNKVNHH